MEWPQHNTKEAVLLQFSCIMRRRPSSQVSVVVCVVLIAATNLILVCFNRFKLSFHTSNHLIIRPNEKKERKYVILAGPGKTASTSIQYNLYTWSERGWLGNDWSWMNPNITCLQEQYPMYCPPFAYVLVHNPWYWKAWGCLSTCLFDSLETKNGTEQCTDVKSCHTESPSRQHSSTNHPSKLVFGSEWIATLFVDLLVKGKNTSFFLQGFVDTLLPSPAKDEITFLITYRSPKLDHLISYWKQINFNRKNQTSFRSMLLLGDTYLPVIDPLYAAKVLATRHGFNVIVIDMSGVKAKGWDISCVVACQILESVPCHGNNMTLGLGGNESIPHVQNVKSHVMEDIIDLTRDEKLQIASTLEKLDCNSVNDIFHHPRIQLLHPYDLKHTLRSCGGRNPPFYTHEQLKKDLQSLVSKDVIITKH